MQLKRIMNILWVLVFVGGLGFAPQPAWSAQRQPYAQVETTADAICKTICIRDLISPSVDDNVTDLLVLDGHFPAEWLWVTLSDPKGQPLYKNALKHDGSDQLAIAVGDVWHLSGTYNLVVSTQADLCAPTSCATLTFEIVVEGDTSNGGVSRIWRAH